LVHFLTDTYETTKSNYSLISTRYERKNAIVKLKIGILRR